MLPLPRRLKWKFNNISAFNHFFNNWPKIASNRNCESLLLPSFGFVKGNSISFETNMVEWYTGFSESTSCSQRNFKRIIHPLWLLLKSISTNNYFFIRKVWLFSSFVSCYSKFLNWIRRNVTKLNRFAHYQGHYFNFKKCSILTNHSTSFFLIGSSPLNIINGSLIANKGWAKNLLLNKEEVAPLPTIKVALQSQFAFTSPFKKLINPISPIYGSFFKFSIQALRLDLIDQSLCGNGFMAIVSPKLSRSIHLFTLFVRKFYIPKWRFFLLINGGHKISAGNAVNLSINQYFYR